MGFNRIEFSIQLQDGTRGKGTHQVPTAYQVSGTYQVLVEGSTTEVTIYSNDTGSSSASNPGTISSTGLIKFFTASTVQTVDIIIYTANGEALFMESVGYRDKHQAVIDRHKRDQTLILPMTSNSNSETDTGFTLVGPVLIGDIDVFVETTDTGETLDIGLDGTTSNDPNGLVAAVSVASLGAPNIGPTITSGTFEAYISANTRGALLSASQVGADVTGDTGFYVERKHLIGESETDANVTYTETTGGDTFTGWMHLHLHKLIT
jgi:hypothetical protein